MPREVDGGLRLAGALQDAARLRAQRKHVARAAQVRGLGLRVDGRQNGRGAVGGGDAGRRPPARLDRDRERRAEVGRVLLDHRRQLEGVAPLLGQGEADQPAPLARHEVDRLRRDLFGGDDEIAFVLAVLVVDDDDELARAKVRDGFLDARKRVRFSHFEIVSHAGWLAP